MQYADFVSLEDWIVAFRDAGLRAVGGTDEDGSAGYVIIGLGATGSVWMDPDDSTIYLRSAIDEGGMADVVAIDLPAETHVVFDGKRWTEVDMTAEFVGGLVSLLGVEVAWREICADLADPEAFLSRADLADLRSFSDLHDFCDANEYVADWLDACPTEDSGDLDLGLLAEIESHVSDRLAAGRHWKIVA